MNMNHALIQFFVAVVFGTMIFSHLTKKNFGASMAYGVQSLAVAALLFGSFLETQNKLILIVVICALIVKVVMAPLFFSRLIRKYALMFSASTYLNTPLTLIAIAILTFIAHSQKFAAVTGIVPANQALLSLALAAMFLSLFLIVNRKGALSHIIGILSLENSIVVFTIFAGLEQSPALQLGILFNIFIWLMIAQVFISMLYKHFGSLNITSMQSLKG